VGELDACRSCKRTPRGKRRIHQKPSTTEVQACWRWLEREIRVVRPDLVIALRRARRQLPVSSEPSPWSSLRQLAYMPGDSLSRGPATFSA
jgi:uracil-DNA glycosylase